MSLFSKAAKAASWILTHPPRETFPADRKRIAFIKQGLFSYSNLRTLEQLRRVFPECCVEVIDVREDLLRAHKLTAATNVLAAFGSFAGDLLTRKRTLREVYYRTPWFFQRLRKMLASRFAGREKEYAFSLATQSLYDASVPGIPHFIYTDHTHLTNLYYPAFDRSRLLAPSIIALEKQAYQNAHRVFVMGSHVARSLVEHYGLPANRAVVIGAGSNIDPSQLPLENDGYSNQRAIFVGVEWARKGGPLLMEAFRKVQRELPDASLTIVGCKPTVRLPNVTVLGRIPRDAVKRELARASLFVFPTRIEPFGIAPIEAHLQNLPVVASDLGAIPDIVLAGKTGALTPTDDPVKLAEAIIDYLQHPGKCREHGEAGRIHVMQNFTWDTTGDRMREAILASLKPAG